MSAPTRQQFEVPGLSDACVEVLRHLWDYLDHELNATSADRLRDHIAQCEQCRKYEGYQACFLEALARVKASWDAPADVREKVAEKLKTEGCGCWSSARGS